SVRIPAASMLRALDPRPAESHRGGGKGDRHDVQATRDCIIDGSRAVVALRATGLRLVRPHPDGSSRLYPGLRQPVGAANHRLALRLQGTQLLGLDGITQPVRPGARDCMPSLGRRIRSAPLLRGQGARLRSPRHRRLLLDHRKGRLRRHRLGRRMVRRRLRLQPRLRAKLPRSPAMTPLRGALAALALLLLTQSALAQQRGKPGEFDFYVLALSWTPSYCEAEGDRRAGDEQCSRARPYAFVVHGLWPQYERGYPRSCVE